MLRAIVKIDAHTALTMAFLHVVIIEGNSLGVINNIQLTAAIIVAWACRAG
jgi:hypothetical protein